MRRVAVIAVVVTLLSVAMCTETAVATMVESARDPKAEIAESIVRMEGARQFN